MRAFGTALAVAMAWAAAAHATACPRKDALGTSRILAVDAATTPRVGLKSFPQTLPLEDHEVVLTFDDGPWPPTTPKVLAALAHECVRATFFLIGKPASEHPELVRRIAAEGHTVGHHTWTHPSLAQIKPDERRRADQSRHIGGRNGVAWGRYHDAKHTVLSLSRLREHAGDARPVAIARHRRVRRRPLGQRLESDDAEARTELLTDRLKAAGKGIILLHDPKAHTAAMLPAFLQYLKENHYRVVHLVPAIPGAKVEAVP